MQTPIKPTASQQRLINILNKYNEEYGKYPDVETLAIVLNCAVSTAMERLRILRKKKLIERNACLKMPNHYKINY